MGDTAFQYVPLDRSTRDIRLLRFLPGSASLDYALETYEIDGCPPYVALSYVWGTDEPTHEIRLNDRVFLVRDNLWHALSRLADNPPDLDNEIQPQYFWIDALCINQNDLLERGHQVDLMGPIFSKARITIAWLGLAEGESDFAMESLGTNLRLFYKDPEGEIKAVLDKNNSRHDMDRAVKSLLSRDYFSRIWVVQEVLLAQTLIILCGSKYRFWRDLSRFAKGNLTLENPFKPSIPNAAQALITARDNMLFKIFPRPSLNTLVMQFGAGKCSDVRDRVYGLLGLIRARSRHSTIPQADYTISTIQVYCRAMAFMQSDQTLVRHGPSYLEEVSTALANALELPRNIHQSISIISTTIFHFKYEIEGSGFCGFSELLHRCILPLEVACDIKLTSPFDHLTKFYEVLAKFHLFPLDDNPKMWYEFQRTLWSLLMIWGNYIRLDPRMEYIPSRLKLPINKERRGKIWAIYHRVRTDIRPLIRRASRKL